MLNETLQHITAWLHLNPHWAGIITFLISFAESLAVIGSIVPGSVTMTAIGILIGSGVIPATSTFLFAILGAIAGDSGSYYLGYYFNDKLHQLWPFSKHPNLLASGQYFFNEHGGKSVFIGRFLGPLRAVVPVVAGMMKMKQNRFLLANVTSAIIWSFLYILPGVFIGFASKDLSKEAASRFIVYILIALVIAWTCIYLLKKIIYFVSKFIHEHTKILWHWSKKHPKLKKYTNLIIDPLAPNSNLQLVFLLLGTTCFILFLSLSLLLYSGYLKNLNLIVLQSVKDLYSIKLSAFLTVITFFGDKHYLALLVGLLFIYLGFIRKHLRTALYLLSLFVTTAATVFFIKHISFVPRPDILAVIKSSSSFPSGHATLSVTIWGFITFILVTPFSKPVKQSIVLPAVTIIAFVLLSRVYLGAHWFADILAGLMLGLSLLFSHLICYYAQVGRKPLVLKETIGMIVIILLSFSIYASLNYQKSFKGYALKQPIVKKHKLLPHFLDKNSKSN